MHHRKIRICTCARQLLIISESSYFCHAVPHRLLAPQSTVTQQLARNITPSLAQAEWILLLLPPGKRSAVWGKMHWAERSGECWSGAFQRLVLVIPCSSKRSLGFPLPKAGTRAIYSCPAIAYWAEENSWVCHIITSKTPVLWQSVLKLLLIAADQNFHLGQYSTVGFIHQIIMPLKGNTACKILVNSVFPFPCPGKQPENPEAHHLFLPSQQSHVMYFYLFKPLLLLKYLGSAITASPHHHITMRTN